MDDLDISIESSCPVQCEEIIKDFWPSLKNELSKLLPEKFFFELAIVGDDTIQSLNKQYRGKDYVTDVLSFEDGDVMPDGRVFLGSIVIACNKAAKQANEIGNSFEEEMCFLFMHGVLHLLGFDHEKDNGEMFELQNSLKKKLISFFHNTED